ncbi:hypothetical protein CSB69_2880 [Morganella morganii]|nr:hypothetical protein CSB69_2880 [Morganella morganii]EMP53074.1 hypothetical protein C790_03050 [Morganella morganii SC01]
MSLCCCDLYLKIAPFCDNSQYLKTGKMIFSQNRCETRASADVSGVLTTD